MCNVCVSCMANGPFEIRLYGFKFHQPLRCPLVLIVTYYLSIPAGEDFVETPYNVTFSDFNSQQSLSTSADVVIINDTMAEFAESFRCVISAPDGEDTRGIVIADPNTVTIAIEDNDGESI